jgi:hypothetical protein
MVVLRVVMVFKSAMVDAPALPFAKVMNQSAGPSTKAGKQKRLIGSIWSSSAMRTECVSWPGED